MELGANAQNLQAALKRVRKNKGSPGIDGMTVEELPEHLKRSLVRAFVSICSRGRTGPGW